MLALHSTSSDCPLQQSQQQHAALRQHKFTVEDFHEDDLGDNVRIRGATASYQLKCEDRKILWSHRRQEQPSADEPPSPVAAAANHHHHTGLHLLAFAGVFDGHGGPLAADYCAKGLLPHVMIETEKSGVTHDLPNESKSSRRPSLREMLQKTETPDSPQVKRATAGLPALEASYVKAFHHAQDHFVVGEDPPDLPPPRKLLIKKNSLRSLRRITNSSSNDVDDDLVSGGTTACTLSIYSSSDADNPGIFAVAANCGDSRLICDGGDGGSEFLQVTRDHRPVDPQESIRLKECVAQGSAYVAPPSPQCASPRIFPGGLAVSRTIGDINFCKGVIPTPDVVRWRLDQTVESRAPGRSSTYRFVLASDGLWDVTTNEQVGALAAQLDSEGVPCSPRTSATKVMEHCLEVGGYMDDVTIMVIDVTMR